jgi:hypothetical protein
LAHTVIPLDDRVRAGEHEGRAFIVRRRRRDGEGFVRRLLSVVASVALMTASAVALAAPAAATTSCGVANNLVQNCGFEATTGVDPVNGDLLESDPSVVSPWTYSPSADQVGTFLESGSQPSQGTNSGPHSGSNFLDIGSGDQMSSGPAYEDSISQTIAGTVPNTLYTLTFWLASDYGGSTNDTDEFIASVSNVSGGAKTLLSVPGSSFAYAEHTYTFTTTPSSGDLPPLSRTPSLRR